MSSFKNLIIIFCLYCFANFSQFFPVYIKDCLERKPHIKTPKNFLVFFRQPTNIIVNICNTIY